MKNKLFALFSALLIAGLFHVQAQEIVPPSLEASGKYKMELIRVADTNPIECLRAIQGFDVGYKSLYSPSLRQWVKNRSAGSTIEWFTSCRQTGCEPTQKETEDFKSYCQDNGVKFIVYPSG